MRECESLSLYRQRQVEGRNRSIVRRRKLVLGAPTRELRRRAFCWLAAISMTPSLDLAATCEVVADASMAVQCGFAKPEDVQFIPSKSIVIVSEQGWKAPESGGIVSASTVDANRRLKSKRQLWPRAVDGIERTEHPKAAATLLGDPSCMTPPNPDAFSPHGLAALDDPRSKRVRVAVV